MSCGAENFSVPGYGSFSHGVRFRPSSGTLERYSHPANQLALPSAGNSERMTLVRARVIGSRGPTAQSKFR